MFKWFWTISSLGAPAIGHFRVLKTLTVKTKLRKNLSCENEFALYACEQKFTFISMDLHFTSLWNRGLRQFGNIIGNSLSTPPAPSHAVRIRVPCSTCGFTRLSFSPDSFRRWRSFEPYPNEHDLVKQARETKRKYCSAAHRSLPFKEFHDPWHLRGNFSHRNKA